MNRSHHIGTTNLWGSLDYSITGIKREFREYFRHKAQIVPFPEKNWHSKEYRRADSTELALELRGQDVIFWEEASPQPLLLQLRRLWKKYEGP